MKAFLCNTCFFLLVAASTFSHPSYAKFDFLRLSTSGREQSEKSKSVYRLSKPLIGDDGRVYACSERILYAFEGNGSIAWSLNLNYTCNTRMAPVHGGRGKIYLVAESRVLKVTFSNSGTTSPVAEVFLGPRRGRKENTKILGFSVSALSSSVYINIEKRGLFAYMTHGPLLWSAGPVINQYGYRQGCRKTIKDCHFYSTPVIDGCESSIYIPNNQGELYCLSARGPRFKWIQDLSSFGRDFTVTPGNNGRLYVTVPARSLVLALDVFSGNILWQGSIGPLSTADYKPVVDSHGWISIGSLDGSLYSYSPTGTLSKYLTKAGSDSAIQISPYLDCSGYAIYVSQTKVEEKISHAIGEYNRVSAVRPKSVVFTLLVPATGSIYWSESYPGQFSPVLSENDMHHFALDEEILLAFAAASKAGDPLTCRTLREELLSSCSQPRAKSRNVYSGEEKAMALFLLFESLVLIVLSVVVRFCCIFWSKRKLQVQGLGKFLLKRRALQVKKKSFDRTISELQPKVKEEAEEEAAKSEVLEKLDNLVREREGVQRKLSTTYSLGRDGAGSQSNSLLPSYDAKLKSYSFQGSKNESVKIFHTLSDTSSEDSIDEMESSWSSHGDVELPAMAKGKAPIEEVTASKETTFRSDVHRRTREPSSSLNVYEDNLSIEQEAMAFYFPDDGLIEHSQNASRTLSLKRRKASSSAN